MKRNLWSSLWFMALLTFAVPILAGQQMMMEPVVQGEHSGEAVVLANACNPCAKNPCANKKMANPCNPCAKKKHGKQKMKNPCNPCGMKMNPCGHDMKNPCGMKMNPCGHKMMNPCNPCGMKMNPCAHHEMANPCKGKR